MTVSNRTRARSSQRVRAGAAAAITAALASAMLVVAPADAAPAPTTFTSSFEADDATPILRGTGEAQNISGARFAPGSLLPHVAAVTASAENPPKEIAANLAD